MRDVDQVSATTILWLAILAPTHFPQPAGGSLVGIDRYPSRALSAAYVTDLRVIMHKHGLMRAKRRLKIAACPGVETSKSAKRA